MRALLACLSIQLLNNGPDDGYYHTLTYPMQAVWWGHPVTSSLTSIDYFISIDDEVPEAALEHYSEQLVRMESINVVPLQTVGRLHCI